LYYYYGKQLRGIRRGPWKLIFPHTYRSYEGVKPGMGGLAGPYAKGHTGTALYNLEEDIGERHNLADKYSEVASELQLLGEKAREDLGDVDRTGAGVRPPGRTKTGGVL
jgi:arylsulfatase